MKRVIIMVLGVLLGLGSLAARGAAEGGSCAATDSAASPPKYSANEGSDIVDPKLKKACEEWRQQLTPEEYHVTREKGTEPAFTGRYWNHHEKGVYRCVCCGAELFSSEAKFDSGSGWPSFWQPIKKENVATRPDNSYSMHRTEVACPRCGAHLGHLFDDGPQPTGQRYCINSASLKFEVK